MFIRSKNNPILKPDKNIPFESEAVYNPGVIFDQSNYHLFYRALGQSFVSKIAYAHSNDGENFIKLDEVFLSPDNKKEKNGIEDARVVKINHKYYLTYTAYDGESARLYLASSDDLFTWEKHGAMLKNWNAKKAGQFLVKWDTAQNNKIAEKEWSKAGGIFSEKFGEKYYMLFGDRNLYWAESKNLLKWKAELKPFLKPRKGYFDSVHIEMGPPPIKTLSAWLVIYHGIDENKTYRLGYLLLDLKNPRKILYRTKNPIFEPEEEYEFKGLANIIPGGLKALEKMDEEEKKEYFKKEHKHQFFPKIIFCNGAVLRDGILRIYYGAGDASVCMAQCAIKDLIKKKNEK